MSSVSKSAQLIKDQFYTPKEVSNRIQNLILPYLPSNPTILEPSVGTGNLLFKGPNWITNDLYPSPKFSPDIQKDFLKENLNLPKIDAIITNPPFGYACNKIRPWIKKCLSISNLVGIILTASWGARYRVDSLPREFELIENEYLGFQSFELPNGEIKKVRTRIQIWKNGKRPILIDPRVNNFLLKDNEQKYIAKIWGYGKNPPTGSIIKRSEGPKRLAKNVWRGISKDVEPLLKFLPDPYEIRDYIESISTSSLGFSEKEIIQWALKKYDPIDGVHYNPYKNVL